MDTFAEEEQKAAAALRETLIGLEADYREKSDEWFLGRLRATYPRKHYELWVENQRIMENPVLDYAACVVKFEEIAFRDSVDAMGPGGLDVGARFMNYHETRQGYNVVQSASNNSLVYSTPVIPRGLHRIFFIQDSMWL